MGIRANVSYNLNAGKWGSYNLNLNGNANTRSFKFALMQVGITSRFSDPRLWANRELFRGISYASWDRSYVEPLKPQQFTLIDSAWTGTGTEGDTKPSECAVERPISVGPHIATSVSAWPPSRGNASDP